MLIYNHKKEFVGIDESDLKALGFSNLTELLFEAADFADLFEKSVGYVHNFKHVHWIDYIICDDSGAKQKVIIRAKGRSYTASLDIQTFHLIDNPLQKSHIVNLLNIKVLSDSKNGQIKIEPIQNPIPQIAEPIKATPVKIESTEGYDPYKPKLDMDDNFYTKANEIISIPIDIDIDELKPEIKMDEVIAPKEPKILKQPPHKPVQVSKTIHEEGSDEYANYIYSSKTASEALGLPIDLIEEFIEDFIVQANSFKADLYQAARDKDMNNLKMLAHKLKGVAANLRVESSLSILTHIGTINEDDDAEAILNKFFRTLDRLENKEASDTIFMETDIKDKADEIDDDDDFILSIKYDEPTETERKSSNTVKTDDAKTPDNIDIIGMDDDFYVQLQEDSQNEVDNEKLPELAVSEEYDCSIADNEALDVAIHYDRELVAKIIGLDIDSFNKLLEEYIETSHQLCKNIVTSAKNGDFNSSKESASELKGMSNNMRIHELDDELNGIINSNNSEVIEKNVSAITGKIDQISNTKDKQ